MLLVVFVDVLALLRAGDVVAPEAQLVVVATPVAVQIGSGINSGVRWGQVAVGGTLASVFQAERAKESSTSRRQSDLKGGKGSGLVCRRMVKSCVS